MLTLTKVLSRVTRGQTLWKRSIMTETCYYTKDGQRFSDKDEFLNILKERLLSPEIDKKPHILFLGENHADPEAHKLELEILRNVHSNWACLKESSLCLSLEFYERDCQTVMDEYLKVRVKL